MILILKELLYVWVIAAVVFWLGRPIALTFMSAGDFSRRRAVWLTLTAIAFVSPNFWVFAALAVPIMIVAGRRDSHPAAFYLMLLQVIPPMDIPVPMIGMRYLFEINNYLLLSFFVLVPLVWRIRRDYSIESRKLGWGDFWLLAYGTLTAFLYIHNERPDGGLYPGSATESLRRAFVFFFITFIPYYAISRSNADRKALVDSMASFCLACGLLSAIAVFESVRHWLLYAEMPYRWGHPLPITPYLARGSSLRAMASTGHSMALGYVLVIALGFWLYLQSSIAEKRTRLVVTLVFWAGLVAAYTRGAWIGALLLYFVFALLRPNPLKGFLKMSAAAALFGLVIVLSPLGDRIVSVLPFLGGKVDSFNVLYRQQLWDRSWEIIRQSPILGDSSALLKMQDLRQGQGIIDLVNTYVGILLDNGFLGLSIFLSFVLLPLFKAWSLSRASFKTDADLGLLGVSLTSCIIVMMVMLENGSFGTGPERVFYVLAALGVAYIRLGAVRLTQAGTLSPVTSTPRAASPHGTAIRPR